MIKPRLCLCSGAKLTEADPRRAGREVVELDSVGDNPSVHIRLEDVAKVFLEALKPRLIDLLEVAAYVFCADCATRRGTEWTDDNTTEPWGRDFHFVIPVRDPVFWASREVSSTLIEFLQFLSDDRYTFDFCGLQRDRPTQEYFQLGETHDWPFYRTERVLMFSGGLDSLAGAVETAAAGGKLVLVSHRSVPTLSRRQKGLFDAMRRTFSNSMIHIPVWINKAKNLGREHTQRSRSFLYASVGTVVAESVAADGVRFFENGVVSLNLPVADEVQRARASRTTHPFALALFERFFGLVTGRQLKIENPYLTKTKADVVSVLRELNAAHLIQYTCSCAHSFFKSKTQWHCGACSQCIDRRIAIIAAGLDDHDPADDYQSDVFVGPRKTEQDKNMAIDYARHAIELNRMSETEIAAKFNLQLTRAVRFMPDRSGSAAALVDVHKRHGETVNDVLQKAVSKHAGDLLNNRLEPTSMLALICGQRHLEPSWRRYSEVVAQLVEIGVPVACKSHKPKDEPHLQQICDGILKGHDGKLLREYPFMRWSSSLTKPDWSAEGLNLWIELKYVRKSGDIRPITEAIASDITKYGDNDRRVLYLVYDPHHLVVDEAEFASPIVSRPNTLVRFFR